MGKRTSSTQLRFSRIDFYRLSGRELLDALFRCIEEHLGDGARRTRRWDELNGHQQGLHAWWVFLGDVENGGLAQFFYNHGDGTALEISAFMTACGNGSAARLLNRAAGVYRKHKREFAVANPFGDDGLFARMTDLQKLDRLLLKEIARIDKRLEKWVRANITSLAVGDTGEPIDPKFSGALETHHPNGRLFELATVRRGILSGPYRRYSADGAIERSSFYEAGEVSTRYWPSGQLKRKQVKQGRLEIQEWYYPSGQLQKRHVADKKGDAVEPVRVWHENGRLAEELHFGKGRKIGPWLKFFADGAPRLQAEHRRDEVFVVKNAWDEKRRQVVKNGLGTYVNDAIDYDMGFALMVAEYWRRSRELRDGVPHGAGMTWHQGVLWSNEEYLYGKLHGVKTLYYDNGRPRRRSIFRDGQEIEAEVFPKFDHPVPAVLMRVESNAELYEAWGEPLLEVYPTPKDLERLQARLAVPAFLRDVQERNRTNSKRGDYEDINTFKDSVSYFVSVNEHGAVERVSFSGCAAYSVSTVDDYPPLIAKLTFESGRSGGRRVPSRVVVSIEHTFQEGKRPA